MSWALVTGGSRGIGRAIAVALSEAGFDVVLTYRVDREGAEETLRRIRAQGGQAAAMPLDLQDKDLSQVLAVVAEKGAPEVLVNNAGVAQDGMFLTMGQQDWDDVMDANVGGFFRLTKACARGMLRRRSGRVISLASVAGEAGNAGQVNYAASKAAIIGASKALARELGPRGITVNVVSPGAILTDMLDGVDQDALRGSIPLGRLGDPEDIARAVAFLAGPGGAYITGQVLSVNGGLYM